MKSVKSALSKQRYSGLNSLATVAAPDADQIMPTEAIAEEAIADEIIVENERRISLILDDRLIDGSIDRLVIRSRGGRPYAAEIIDFKTDRWHGQGNVQNWIDERFAYHLPQLQAYVEVVTRMLKLPKNQIDCSILLLSADVCIRCDQNSESVRPRKAQQLKLAF